MLQFKIIEIYFIYFKNKKYMKDDSSFIEKSIDTINKFNNIVINTPLELNKRLSKKYNCSIYIKREDKQDVRSFKIRGALNKILSLSYDDKLKGVVCASAGNHAQGVAQSCNILKIKGDIFIPEQTPMQKLERIKFFGGEYCTIYRIGKSFNDCLDQANKYCSENNKIFVHPYNDINTIIGQSTIAHEIFEKIKPDYIITTIGGGGLASGLSLYKKDYNLINNTSCKIIGVEPDTCDSMNQSINKNEIVTLKVTDNFVDGATVSRVGDLTFNICKDNLEKIIVVNTGKLCETMLELYQNDGIITEPAGALSIASLDYIDKEIIKDKNIVCILTGGNNDLLRYPEIIGRSLEYKNLKHYYLIRFGQTPGQLKKFINSVLGENDDICRFEYIKKTNKEFGDVLIGIEVEDPKNVIKINYELTKNNFDFIKLNKDNPESALLYNYII